jgi:hypothetical protein
MMNRANIPRGAHPKRRGCAPYKFYTQDGTDPTFELLVGDKSNEN